jgi:hypothetical protein
LQSSRKSDYTSANHNDIVPHANNQSSVLKQIICIAFASSFF